MTTATTLQEEINQQASIFSKEEIEQNLLAKGYNAQEIKAALATVKVESNSGGNSSTKGILLGILFGIIVLFRIARFANTGGIFVGLGIITGIGMMIYFFTKKN